MQYVDPFIKVVEAERTGLTVDVKVKSLNKGGLVVMFGEFKGALRFAWMIWWNFRSFVNRDNLTYSRTAPHHQTISFYAFQASSHTINWQPVPFSKAQQMTCHILLGRSSKLRLYR